MTKRKFPVKKVKMPDTFRICPECGYKDGFHNMFRRSVDNGHLDWFLVCPNCSAAFDIGLTFEHKPR